MFLKNSKKMFATSVLMISCLVLMACPSANSILKYLDIALEIATQAAGATGILPPVYTAYVSAGLGCIEFAATETGSTDSPAVQSAKITGACAALVSPVLPPGTPQALVNLAGKLAQAITNLLSSLPSTKDLASAHPIKLSAVQVTHLQMIASKAKADKAAFLAAHKLTN